MKNNGWHKNNGYYNTYLSIANNEAEYLSLIKNLCSEFDKHGSFGGQVFEFKETLFEDWASWHTMFETDAMFPENDEDDEFPDPATYNGNVGYKPKLKDYPVVLVFLNLDSPSLMFHSLKELGGK